MHNPDNNYEEKIIGWIDKNRTLPGQKILVKGNIRTFSVMKDTLRDLTEKIDRNPDLTRLDPIDAERLKTILEITNYLFGERR